MRSGRAEKLRCRRTRGRIAGLASGGRTLRRRHGRAMKRSRLTGCSSCSLQVLACLSFDPFCRWIFGARSSRTVRTRVSDGPCRSRRSAGPPRTVRIGADGPRVHHGRSVIEGAVLEVRGLLSDGPPQTRGQSA
jgi:hypothetical protein